MSEQSLEQNIRGTRERLLELTERETATTLKVLRAYPSEQSELKPHPRLKTARELAWLFASEQMLAIAAINDTLDLSAGFPPAPSRFDEVVASFEHSRNELIQLLRTCSDAQLAGTTQFFVAPRTMGDVPKLAFLEFLVHDQIHHRGQFSVYLRMADGKVPSIYGPTADEPWT
ncbi:DinB family protein [soil metagenome]